MSLHSVSHSILTATRPSPLPCPLGPRPLAQISVPTFHRPLPSPSTGPSHSMSPVCPAHRQPSASRKSNLPTCLPRRPAPPLLVCT